MDNVRVAETQVFSEGGILEQKPQMKHSFVSVPDEEYVLCQLHAIFCSAALWSLPVIYYLNGDTFLLPSEQTGAFSNTMFSDVFLCAVFIWWCSGSKMLTLLIQVSVILGIPDYGFGLFGAVFLWFFYLRYNISFKFPNRTFSFRLIVKKSYISA